MDEYAFSFINVNNGELLSQWGRTGEGPEEFIDFGSGFEIVDSRIVFLDRMKKERISVLLSDILSKKEHPEKQFSSQRFQNQTQNQIGRASCRERVC